MNIKENQSKDRLSEQKEEEHLSVENAEQQAAPQDGGEADSDYSYPLSYYEEETKERDASQHGSGDAHYQSYQPPPPPPMQEPVFREIPEDRGFSIHALTEGAMMVAISLLLAAVSLYIPILSFAGSLLYPLPIAILVLRRGMKVALTATITLLALSVILFGFVQGLLMLLQYGVVGLFLGQSFRCERKPIPTLAIASVLAAAATLLDIMLSMAISGLPLTEILGEFDVVVQDFLQIIQQSGMQEQLVPTGMTIEQYGDLLLEQMQRLIPGVLIMSAMILTTVLYLVSSHILRRLRYNIPCLPRYEMWRMDWRWVWGAIVGLLLRFAASQFDISWLDMLGANLLYIFSPVLVLCGLAFVIWLFRRAQMGFVIKILIVFLAISNFSLTVYVLMFVGVVDSVYDLRSRLEKRAQQREQDRQDRDSF